MNEYGSADKNSINEAFGKARARWDTLQELVEHISDRETAEDFTDKCVNSFMRIGVAFSASRQELEKAGLSVEQIRLMSLIKQVCTAYIEDRSDEYYRVYNTASAYDILRPKFFKKKHEAVAAIMLNGRGHVVYIDVIFEGSVSAVPVYVRRILDLCIRHGAESVILAHNHPTGSPLPSENDISSTLEIERLLKGIEVWLEDHIIIAGDDSMLSFKDSGILDLLRKENTKRDKEDMERAKKLEQSIFNS